MAAPLSDRVAGKATRSGTRGLAMVACAQASASSMGNADADAAVDLARGAVDGVSSEAGRAMVTARLASGSGMPQALSSDSEDDCSDGDRAAGADPAADAHSVAGGTPAIRTPTEGTRSARKRGGSQPEDSNHVTRQRPRQKRSA